MDHTSVLSKMAPSSKPSLVSFTIYIISTFVTSLSQTTQFGFTVELIHRDSPKSPLFDSTTTPFEKLYNAALRSTERANHLFPDAETKSNDPESDLTTRSGEYMMDYALGSPKFWTRSNIDTGSDLTWLQCTPCNPCYPQFLDLYDPLESITKIIPGCFDHKCIKVAPSVDAAYCDENCFCRYSAVYADHSSSKGNIYSDTLTLRTTNGETVAFPLFLYGCGRENSGLFYNPYTSGIVGLGRGPASLVSQTYYSIQGKFAYCLVPFNSRQTGKLMFGQNAVVSGSNVVSTPMVSKHPFERFYFITLEAISVGNAWIDVTPVQEGNMAVDSGTILSRLRTDLHSRFAAELSAQLDLIYQNVDDPTGIYRPCYSVEKVEDIEVPPVVFHFTDAPVNLESQNIFSLTATGVACFNMIPTNGQPMYGALTQTNFIVGYDLQRERISFKKEDCTRI